MKEEIKNRLLPSRIIGASVNLKQKSSGEFLGLCPFHNEKTPSFSVSDNKKFYHCFGCGEHGDIFEFVIKTTGMQYHDVLEKLASEAGVRIPEKREAQARDKKDKVIESIYEEAAKFFENALRSREGSLAMSYLKNRGLLDETIQEFQIGFAPIDSRVFINYMKAKFKQSDLIESKLLIKSPDSEPFMMFRNRVMFPICDLSGRIVAFGGRAMSDDMKPKYINSTDTPLFKKGEVLYSLNRAKLNIKSTGSIVVVEGYMDVISMYQAGFKAAVAPLGTALKASQIQTLWNYTDSPILCMDGDVAGRKSALKAAISVLPLITADKNIKVAEINGAKDPDELISLLGYKGIENLLKGAKLLSGYLFDVHAIKYNFKLPEEVLKLKSVLDKLLEEVKDNNIRREFDQFFKNQIFERKRSGAYKHKNTANNAEHIIAVIKQELDNGEKILKIIEQFPYLLRDNMVFEQFINLDLKNKKLDARRKDVLSKFEEVCEGDDISRNDVKDEDMEIKTVEEAKVCVIRLFRLNNLEVITEEINYLVGELKALPDQSVFIRLANLKRAEEELKIDLGII